MVKVGDRVRLVKIGESVGTYFGYVEGDTATVADDNDMSSIKLSMDSPKNGYCNIWVRVDEIDFVTETPPVTIQQEGYEYIRGVRLVPEWVKDGQWVVHKISGVVARLSETGLGFDVRYPSHVSYNVSASDVHERFRPFTNEDWKWGMWAEYEGEKVFVCSSASLGHVGISRGSENTGERPTIAYITGVPAAELTPTTAP